MASGMGFNCQPRRLFQCEMESSSRDLSPDRGASPDVDEVCRVCCTCKSTCQRRKCPCKVGNLFCGEWCKCGTKKNPCRNQPPAEDNVLTPESARKQREQIVQEYATSLTIQQCYKLIVKAYSNIGGLELAKALVTDSSLDIPQDGNYMGYKDH